MLLAQGPANGAGAAGRDREPDGHYWFSQHHSLTVHARGKAYAAVVGDTARRWIQPRRPSNVPKTTPTIPSYRAGDQEQVPPVLHASDLVLGTTPLPTPRLRLTTSE
jgi:hypothetical protein